MEDRIEALAAKRLSESEFASRHPLRADPTTLWAGWHEDDQLLMGEVEDFIIPGRASFWRQAIEELRTPG